MIDVDAGWRQAPTRKVYTCDRADRDRRVEAWVGVVIGGSMMLGFVLLAFVYSITPNVVLVVSAGLSLVLSGAGRFVLCSRIRESPSRWRRGDGAVEFGPCWGFLLWEQMPPLTLTIGVALALRMPFPPRRHPFRRNQVDAARSRTACRRRAHVGVHAGESSAKS